MDAEMIFQILNETLPSGHVLDALRGVTRHQLLRSAAERLIFEAEWSARVSAGFAPDRGCERCNGPIEESRDHTCRRCMLNEIMIAWKQAFVKLKGGIERGGHPTRSDNPTAIWEWYSELLQLVSALENEVGERLRQDDHESETNEENFTPESTPRLNSSEEIEEVSPVTVAARRLRVPNVRLAPLELPAETTYEDLDRLIHEGISQLGNTEVPTTSRAPSMQNLSSAFWVAFQRKLSDTTASFFPHPVDDNFIPMVEAALQTEADEICFSLGTDHAPFIRAQLNGSPPDLGIEVVVYGGASNNHAQITTGLQLVEYLFGVGVNLPAIQRIRSFIDNTLSSTTTRPENPRDGDSYFDLEELRYFVYVQSLEEWVPIGEPILENQEEEEQNTEEESRLLSARVMPHQEIVDFLFEEVRDGFNLTPNRLELERRRIFVECTFQAIRISRRPMNIDVRFNHEGNVIIGFDSRSDRNEELNGRFLIETTGMTNNAFKQRLKSELRLSLQALVHRCAGGVNNFSHQGTRMWKRFFAPLKLRHLELHLHAGIVFKPRRILSIAADRIEVLGSFPRRPTRDSARIECKIQIRNGGDSEVMMRADGGNATTRRHLPGLLDREPLADVWRSETVNMLRALLAQIEHQE